MTYKTESELIDVVRAECGSSNWRLGEQAALWKEKWGQTKTDEDFCRMVGGEAFSLTPDRVGRCRRVWQQFGMIHGQYRGLTWSHFDKARQLSEVNQTEALVWAEENEATVGEMLAWMRATFGEVPEEKEEGPRGEGLEPRGEEEKTPGAKSPAVKSPAAVKAKGGDGAAVAGEGLGPMAESLGEEEDGETDPDHPMALIDAGHEPSAISHQPSARPQVANLIRCLKLEEQTLRRMWADLTAEERREVAAVIELLVEFLTLEAVA